MSKSAIQLRIEYEKYLDSLGVSTLRSLAREVGVDKPTKGKTKDDLIRLIICILMGEIEPIERSLRGAPVKAQEISPKILFRLHEIGGKSVDCVLQRVGNFENRNLLTVRASDVNDEFMPAVYLGQIVLKGEEFCVYPLNGFAEEPLTYVGVEFQQNYNLKSGDVISYLKKETSEGLRVSQIFKINDAYVSEFQRNEFSQLRIANFNEIIPFSQNKVVDWFFPIYKGGRCLVVSPAKSGKTELLKQLSEELSENNSLKTICLLIEQTNESFFPFRGIISDRDLVGTAYDHDAEEHFRIAEFALNRAKAYVESGKDVVLIVEGVLALAKAYDECHLVGGSYLSSGLSAKAVRYIKKFLASARNIDGKGSLTMICSLPIKTGNPDDDLFFAEISPIFETQISLDVELAKNRIYPAIDFTQSRTNAMGEVDLKKLIGKENQVIVELINQTESSQEFCEKIEKI